MNEVIRLEVIKLPKICIVGKKIRYSDEALNNGDNRLPDFWNKCYEDNIFAPLESQTEHIFESSHAGVFIDWDLGDGDFSYIVGMLMTEDAAIPEGYVMRNLEGNDTALCHVKCKELSETRTVPFESTAKAIQDIGRSFFNIKWCIDLYHHLRSTIPDENGEVILDCYIPLD